jgi:hypothetical protein
MNPSSIAAEAVENSLNSHRIELEPNLAEFCEAKRLVVDGRPFDLSKYPYLDPIYRGLLTKENLSKADFKMVLMFGAQTGKTILLSTLVSYLCLVYKASSWGFYFPVEKLAQLFSSERYEPLVRSNMELGRLMTSDEYTIRRQSVTVRHLGLSSVYFLFTGGKVSTESFPFWGVIFDEVRRMMAGDIERAEERIQASPHKINIKSSTAGFPESDIHSYFVKSNQSKWHTQCKCPDGVVLADEWPNCVLENESARFYFCPHCKTIIDKPAEGHYVAHNPSSNIPGFTVPQILSPTVSLDEIWEAWKEKRDRQEFYNSKLGIPWVDKDTQPVSDAVFRACINPEIKWEKDSNAEHNYMGVDQRANENHVVILRRQPGGKFRLIHLEIIQDESPFDRLYALMVQYRVTCAVVDENPNANDAMKFARKHRGRAFVTTYHEVKEGIRWGDKLKPNESLRRTKTEDQFQWFVRVDRYKSIDALMNLFVNQDIELPPPEGLIQPIQVGAKMAPIELALGSVDLGEPGLLMHIRSIARARVRIYKNGPDGTTLDTGQDRMEWHNLRGVDPHFVHALNYAIIASERQVALGEFYLSDEQPMSKSGQAEQIDEIKKHVVQQATGTTMAPQKDTCADCRHYRSDPNPGQPSCTVLNVNTRAEAPICNEGFSPVGKEGEDSGYYIV